MEIIEAEDIKKRWQEYMEELYKKIFMDREAWRAAIHGVAKSGTWLSY